MSAPYSAPYLSRLLRVMPMDQLRRVTPEGFQRWPAQEVIALPRIADLIRNELARRSK
jgi:hypothetical protein